MSGRSKCERLRKRVREHKTKTDAAAKALRANKKEISSVRKRIKLVKEGLGKPGVPLDPEKLKDALKQLDTAMGKLEATAVATIDTTTNVSLELRTLRRDNREAQRALMEPLVEYLHRAPHTMFASGPWGQNLLHTGFYQTSEIEAVCRTGTARADISGREHALPAPAAMYMSARQRNQEPVVRLTGSDRGQVELDRKARENKTKAVAYVTKRASQKAQSVPDASSTTDPEFLLALDALG